MAQMSYGQGFNINPNVGVREFNPGTVNRLVYDPINDIVYVTGTYDAAGSSPDFDTDPGNIVTLPAYGPAGTVDVFLAKYSSSGLLLSVVGIGGDGNDIPITLDYDASGNVYLGGTYNSSSIDLDPDVTVQSLANAGGFDGFAVVLDQAGNFLQGSGANSAGGDAVRGIQIDQFGDIVIMGNIDGSMFYERYAGDLTILPDISFSVPGANGRELLLDSNDDIIVCGVYSNSVDFDPGIGMVNHTSNGLNDYFLAYYNGFDGSLISVNTFGGAGDDLLRRVAIGPSDEVIFTGIFNADFDADPDIIGTNILSSTGMDDFFISKFNSDQTLAWSFAFGGSGNDNVHGVYVNSFGDIFTAGKFNGTIDFDPLGTYEFTSTDDDAFLFKLHGDGTFGKAIAMGNSGQDETFALVAIDDAVSISYSYFETQNADLDPNCAVVTLNEYNRAWLGYQDVGIVGEPASQPTNLTFPTVTATSITGSFTSAATGPSGYLVLMSAGQLPDIDPVDGMDYCLNDQLGLNGAGEIIYAIASGNINGFTSINHAPGEELFYKIFSFNGFGSATNYNTTNPLTNSQTTLIAAATPGNQASNLQTPTVGNNQADITWTRGDGNNVLIVVREGDLVDAIPVQGQSYSSSTIYGDPTAELGTGNYVVYNGSATSVTVTSLTLATSYHVRAFEYNGSGGTENYLTTTAAGNPASFTTTGPSEPTVQASNLQFTTITNTEADFSWNFGNGTDAIVVVKAVSAVDQLPIDGSTYTASSVFGLGDELVVASGNYVVYKGPETTVTVTGLSPGTSYHVRAFEYNGNSGSENYLTATAVNNPNSFTTTNICGGDFSEPVIAHTPMSSVELGADLTVTVNVTDPDGCPINYVVIYYSALDELDLNNPQYTPGSMQQASAGSSTYTFTISGKTSNLGVEYFFEAADDAANIKSGDVYYNVPVAVPDGSYTIPYSSFGSDVSNYRIISVPLTNYNASVNTIFDELDSYDKTKWRMYQYAGGSTSELNGNSSLSIGRGYWLIVKDNPGEALTVGGGRVANSSYGEPYVINLTSGWNLIGNPYPFDISWSEILAYNNDPSFTPDLKVYRGSGSYSNGTELEKFSGGFVLSTGSYQLQIPAYRNPGIQGGRKGSGDMLSRKKNAINQSDWEVNIAVSTGKLENTFGGIGMNREASEYFDNYDDLTLPRFLDYVEIVHDNPKKFNSYFSKDIVPSTDNYIWEFKVESNSGDDRSTLIWQNDYFGDNEKQLYLWDNQLQRSVDMRSATEYIFDRNVSSSFKIIYGDDDFIKEQTIVEKIVFHKILPNPAAEAVTLAFTLPEAKGKMPVNFEAVDLMGRRIWQTEQSLSGGYHEVYWDINPQVVSGMYIIKVQSGQYADQQRLIIKK